MSATPRHRLRVLCGSAAILAALKVLVALSRPDAAEVLATLWAPEVLATLWVAASASALAVATALLALGSRACLARDLQARGASGRRKGVRALTYAMLSLTLAAALLSLALTAGMWSDRPELAETIRRERTGR